MTQTKFAGLLERRGLTQEQFAETVGAAWSRISGRTLSRQAVNAWVRGRTIPRLSPAETLVLIEVLGCTLTELAFAFQDGFPPDSPDNDSVREA